MSSKKSLRVVFMGTPDFSVPTLEALVRSDFSVVGVYCQPDKQKGRGKQVQMPPVKMAALAHDLPVYQPVTLRDETIQAQLEQLNPDIIVVIAYGKILPPWLIRLPQYGCINIHASALPKYRGAAPIHYAVLNGDKETGVTIMHMDDGLDTGDIIDIVKTDILPGETTGELFDRIAQLGADTIVPVLHRWVNGEINAVPQNDEEATHTAKITKEMGFIDWNRSSVSIVNLIRGLNPAPGCYTFLGGKRLKIWRADLVEQISADDNTVVLNGKSVMLQSDCTPGTIVSRADGLIVATGDHGFVRLIEVQPENKKRISANDFVNGHQIKDGMVFGNHI
nr:methionyl-tRNA formyltransferase [Veillonella denticariosi]